MCKYTKLLAGVERSIKVLDSEGYHIVVFATSILSAFE